MSQNNASAGAILQDARVLNSDLGRFVRRCNFSTNLSGRFYENNSMHSHNARAHRIAKMKAKRKELEKSLRMEQRKIDFIESQLRKKLENRHRAENMKVLMRLSATKIQSHVRKHLAINRAEVLRVEGLIVNYLAIFIQSIFRGRRDRRRVQYLRIQMFQHRKEELASIRIQSVGRRLIAKLDLMKRRQLWETKRGKAALILQTYFRGMNSRQKVQKLRRNFAVISIQCMYRMVIAKRLHKLAKARAMKKKERPRRIPLHERRYSTYASETSNNDPKRRFTDISGTVLKLKQFQDRRRRSSLVTTVEISKKKLLNMATIKHDEEGSVRSIKSTSTKQKTCADSDDGSSTSISSEHNDDKIRKARLKASMRAAKLKKKNRVGEEEKARRADVLREELIKLEQKRKSVLERELASKKQIKGLELNKSCCDAESSSEALKETETKASVLEHKGNIPMNLSNDDEDHTRLKEKENCRSEELCSPIENIRLNLPMQLNLDFGLDDFEDDMQENEDDLM